MTGYKCNEKKDTYAGLGCKDIVIAVWACLSQHPSHLDDSGVTVIYNSVCFWNARPYRQCDDLVSK